MNIKKIFKNIANVQFMRAKVASQKGRVTKLENQVHKLQMLIKDDILSLVEKTTTYKGNEYTSYSQAITEINNKYNGTADWGVLQTGAIIDLRAAFIIGEGIKVVQKGEEDASIEIAWANKFLEYNQLDKEMAQEFAKEAEIEGKIAIKLASEETEIIENGRAIPDVKISSRYISWLDKGYTIKTSPQDYMDYQQLTWKPKDKDKPEILEANEFVYKKFGGRISDPNQAAPKILKCLTEIDSLSKALRDWREIDRIFASPILAVECPDTEAVKSTKEALTDKNWKVKKMFIARGKLYYAQFDMGGVTSIEKEILTLAKMISGTTGIPVSALGLPELMSNRATAENLMEFVLSATTKERQIWKGAYEEIIRKAMVMYNELIYQGLSQERKLNPDRIKVEIPQITKDQWEHLERIFLPGCIAGKISDELFLEKIPGVNAEKELERKQAKEGSEFERIKAENEDLKNKNIEKDLFGGNQNVPVSK